MSALRLGPDVVGLLLPHRRPFRMVDRVEDWAGPTLRASRYVSANEAVFDGHAPGLHLWPGVYTIEGMGQSCNLQHVLAALAAGDPEVAAALADLDASFRPGGKRSERAERLVRSLALDPLDRIGLGVRVDVKLVAPVYAGRRIDYRVTHTHTIDGIGRYEVSAAVEGQLVAEGVMMGALGGG